MPRPCPPQRRPAANQPTRNALRAIAAFAISVLLIYARYYLAPGFLSQVPFIRDMIFLFLIPILLLPLLKLRPSEAGLQVGGSKAQLIFVALALLASLPPLFLAAQSPVFNTYYPLFGWAREGVANLAAYEFLILIFMLATEFFFRGFLMMGMSRLGAPAAITLQAIPYTLVHFGKPPLEIPASLIAGLFFGWMDWRAKSVLPSTLLHWCINLAFDLLCLHFYFAGLRPL